MKLVIGLGNPDKEQENTRHNFGWMVIDSMVNKSGAGLTNDKSGLSQVAQLEIGTEKTILCKPMTYMNKSGLAVKALQQFYKISTEDIIVIYDEIDLNYGTLRVSQNKSAGGHRGVDSIINELGDKNFIRVRLGIGPQKGSAEDFVLKKFSTEEKKKLPEILDTAYLAVETIVEKGVIDAANKYN